MCIYIYIYIYIYTALTPNPEELYEHEKMSALH